MADGLAVRRPAVAGQFYPGNEGDLRRMVRRFVEQAELPADLLPVRAVIAPHAGYVYSGPTAGYAFKALSTLPPAPRTIYLMGPAHRYYVPGVALGAYTAFQTPLGSVPVDTERVEELLQRSPLYVRAPQAHAAEHCLEVELPFLQETLSGFRIVPMLFGEVDAVAVGRDLDAHLRPGDLIVVSSDLSHYHPYDTARQLDQGWLDALLRGRGEAVAEGEACGRAPATALMVVARARGWQPRLLDYRTSGDTAGDKWQVVGYASVAYTEPGAE